uniref:Uncharacterized protein n=1 Tax=Nymphaea colorata TaxID=210225 RepID=A0A5K1A7J9_9MAGN
MRYGTYSYGGGPSLGCKSTPRHLKIPSDLNAFSFLPQQLAVTIIFNILNPGVCQYFKLPDNGFHRDMDIRVLTQKVSKRTAS